MSIDFIPEPIARPGTRRATPAKRTMTAERRAMLRRITRRHLSHAEPAEQYAARQFAAETSDHEMTVLHDDGVYRHVRFAKPGTGIWSWTLTTWPGHLCIDGDLESFTFSREHDMFEFFACDGARINPHYWAEKITNHAARRGTHAFSESKAVSAVVQDFLAQRHYVDGPTADAWLDLRNQVIDEIHTYDSSLFHEAVNRWNYDGYHFTDTYEWDVSDWDHHYLIACHAIAWGIAKYRKAVQP
ncbi:hypothetical protein [Rhodococcus aetherivorans]|uniref:hypothetical protein n=1 Tax=Rhodococcus aetherivorans TaxID=191292 RepID=UPI0002D24107|nr:hypothetical protein [Rhodococcus aetherivorans]CCW14645.1 hypothetical protein EBESD8_52150 [Rhodococcus aetherivorans]